MVKADSGSGDLAVKLGADCDARTVNEATYRRLNEDIVSGRLAPGHKLRFTELHQSYGVGTGTIREALSRLASEQLVVSEGQRGFRVAPISMADLWDMTRLLSQVETQAIENAINHLDVEGEAAIIAAFHRLSRFGEVAETPEYLNTAEGARLHRAFHMSLLAKCDSDWLKKIVTLLYDHSERYRRLLTSHSVTGRDSSAEHLDIMNATIGRDVELAKRLLREHIERTAELLGQAKDIWNAQPGPKAHLSLHG